MSEFAARFRARHEGQEERRGAGCVYRPVYLAYAEIPVWQRPESMTALRFPFQLSETWSRRDVRCELRGRTCVEPRIVGILVP